MPSSSSAFAKIHWTCWVALTLPLIAFLATPDGWPRWAVMWVLCFAIYATCKIMTWSTAARHGVTIGRQLAYLFAWPGLDANAFLQSNSSSPPKNPAPPEWAAAILKTLLGILIFWTAQHWLVRYHPVILGWAGMTGFALMVHFGLFHILSCAWRAAGIDARPLMNAPLRS